ncbi:MAG TPA: hypothetical protein VLX59_09205, partial [Acidimicrobiales bacterium]|nr:hypothetical protein [Acidimicrobiales bacterium]
RPQLAAGHAHGSQQAPAANSTLTASSATTEVSPCQSSLVAWDAPAATRSGVEEDRRSHSGGTKRT